MASISLDDCVLGGVVVARPWATIQELHDGYLARLHVPGPVVSASDCIGDVLPDHWMFSWLPEASNEEREDAAGEWGIPKRMVPDLVAWVQACEASQEMAFAQLFLELRTAQSFVRRFLPAAWGGRVLGLALARELVPAFIKSIAQLGSAQGGNWRCPTSDLLLTETALPRDGLAIGYEVLGISPWEERHSWHCHGIARDMHEQFGVLPGPGALFVSLEDAQAVATWCNDPSSGTEPCVWAPWLLLDYGAGEIPK